MTDPDPQPSSRQNDDMDVQLERLLDEAEATVSKLRAELAESRRKQSAADGDLDAGDIAAQKAEVARLQEHLADAQVHWSEVRAFFEAALAELLARRRRIEPDADNGADGLGQ